MSFFEQFRRRFKKEDINSDVDEKRFNKLSSLFIKNPKKAIEKSTKYFLSSLKKTSYDQYIEKIKSTQKSNVCPYSWNKRSLCVQCFNCQKEDSTCFCIPCFLAGHHDNHDVCLICCEMGSCDCGNPSAINPTGFCQNHRGPDPNPDISQMNPDDRKKFITVFKAAYFGAMNFTSNENFIDCIKYISDFIRFGDGLRRCAAYSIISLSKEYLFGKISKMNEEMTGALIDLFGQLISDVYFNQEMSFLYFVNYQAFYKKFSVFLINHDYNDVYKSLRCFDRFSFNYFSMCSAENIAHKSDFNWTDFLVNYIDISLKTLIQSKYEYDENYEANTLFRLINVSNFLKSMLSLDHQHDKIQEFIDKYSDLLVNYECMIPFHIHTTPQDESDEGYNASCLMCLFGKINRVFTSNTKNRTPNNFQFSIKHVIYCLNQFHKKNKSSLDSILNAQKKIKVSTIIPLHNLLYCLTQNYDDIRSLIENECKNNGIDFQQFCSMTSIQPLRNIAAFFMSGKFSKLNEGFMCVFKDFIESPLFTFNHTFGLVQTLVGISYYKEKIIENALSIFGCFEDISEFKQELKEIDYDRQVHLLQNVELEAGIFLMSLLTDHSILSLNKNYFNRQRVIELLKKSHATAKDIQEYICEDLIDQNFSNELVEYIQRVPNKKGCSYFTLKDDGDFTPFFPLIHVNDRINLLMKYNDKLIPTFDYEDYPRGISLKSCFRSPAFIALTFKILSTNYLTQVGVSMFISLVKNGEKISPDSFNTPNPISIKASNLQELITEFSKIEDRLNEVNILTINVSFENKEPTTLMALIQSNKNLANLAFQKCEIPLNVTAQKDKFDDVIQARKAKAALFKQRLMKEYQNKRKQFGSSEAQKPSTLNDNKNKDDDDDEGDDEPSENVEQDFNNTAIICNVCLSNQDDIFGFPCLSLPTTLPSLIHNKLHGNSGPPSMLDKTYTINMCSHHIHYKCYLQLLKDAATKMSVQEIMSCSTRLYQCTIDRGDRNCFLPIFQSTENEFKVKPSPKMSEVIDDFMTHAFYYSSDRAIPIKSFAGIVLKLEVRLRNNPDALDSPNIPILLSNLLLTIYHNLHISLIGVDLSKKLKDPLSKFVYMLIKSDDPIKDFRYYVQISSADLKPDFLYEFLRRCAIIEDFAIKRDSVREKFIDWDDVYSFDNLLQRFCIAIEEDTGIELPIFKTIQLPEKFINLWMPPYNAGYSDSELTRVIDLITGKSCIVPSENSKKEKDSIVDYVNEMYNGGLAMFLVLTGEKASSVLFYSAKIKKEWYKDSFYTDKFGDVDIGFKRGVLTSLSNDRLENSLDALLSGDVILY